MEHALESLFIGVPVWGLIVILAVALLVLGKGANILVDEAVAFSVRMQVPTVIIGATVVSLGTTLPEASVSVMAALSGQPDIALGNAVGSIICDTGLILGIGALISPLPLDKRVVNKQGWMQLGAGFLLVLLCLPFHDLGGIFTEGGRLPRWGGVFLVALLVVYIGWSIHSSKGMGDEIQTPHDVAANVPSWIILAKLALGIALVILASKAIIPSGKILAERAGLPPEVISASLIAFGTSLPELVTVVTSVLKGRGDLAVGNVIGADILNVLFVSGVSAAVTPGGLEASPVFFYKFFPFMLGLLIVFRIGIWKGGKELGRPFGALLLALYGVFLWLNFQ
jgi:cation:H+ antiporter